MNDNNENKLIKPECLLIGRWSAALQKHSNGQTNALIHLEHLLVNENDQLIKDYYKYVAFLGFCKSKIVEDNKCILDYKNLERRTLCNPKKKSCSGLASIELKNFDFTKNKLAILVCIVLYEEFTDSWDYSKIKLQNYKADVINDNDYQTLNEDNKKFELGWQVIIAYGTVLILLFILLFWTMLNKHRNIAYQSEIPIYHNRKISMTNLPKQFYAPSDITIKFEKPIAIGNTSIICKGYFGSRVNIETIRNSTMEDSRKFAVKIPKVNITEKELHELSNEFFIYKQLGEHSKIVNFLGYTTLHNKKILLMEYCSKYDLKSYLKLCRQHAYGLEKLGYDISACDPLTVPEMNEELMITLKIALGIAVQIICGMEYLFVKEVIHCSLQAKNIFLAKNFSIKIGDFGKSLYAGGTTKHQKTFTGLMDIFDGENYRWLPIEAIKYSKFSNKTDIWSFGILLQELLTLGGFPYHNSVYSKEGYQTFLEQNKRLPKSENTPDSVYQIQLTCWELNKENRPKIHQLKASFVDLYKSIVTSDYIQNYNFIPSKDISIYQNYLEKNSYIPMIDKANYIETDYCLTSNLITNTIDVKHNFLSETERLLGYQSSSHINS
uniref:Protein kinase domain-containing protein n=1 Tax=Parastrongyloides trichosuri TaxID=131310 RepID=A0A0N4ZSC5_PARTI